ncbi:toxin-antitoxin system YwqK family antitoxin [Chitinophaga vietnamensis]|uniref:toxin-antitoxin system YwqK family antitoxin n=1 Tax=Chitinophaga vietnamensis TaxID=2593957 RepID=UPI0011785804|nr:hypothetical protein [Chitinophaga vietnamensis]
MKKLIFLLLLLGMIIPAMAQQKSNQRDAQHRKQGYWIEEVGELRGEPGYTWEGTYKNGRKEGVWKKTTTAGFVIAEETYKNNVLDGYCKYYYPNGKRSAEGRYIATEIEGQRDTVMVIDPVTDKETPTEIVRMGNSVKHGLWKMYDEETGQMVKEYYNRGEVSTAAEMGDTDTTAAPASKPAPVHLPHEEAAKRKKKG